MKSLRVRAVDLVDILVYLVVLSLFVQLFPEVISESFVVSLLTAILLKLALEAIVWAKVRIVQRIKGADTTRGRLVASASLVALSALSKALILWLTDVVLGDNVHLGGFWSVTLLVVALMACRALLRRLVAD